MIFFLLNLYLVIWEFFLFFLSLLGFNIYFDILKCLVFFYLKIYYDINLVFLIINVEYYVIIKEKFRIFWICTYMM